MRGLGMTVAAILASTLVIDSSANEAKPSWIQSGNWQLTGTVEVAGPVVTLRTGEQEDRSYYMRRDVVLRQDGGLSIEAVVRVLDEDHGSGHRYGVVVGFSTGSEQGNVLGLGRDKVMLWSATDEPGPTISVDTDDAFHTYRIEVDRGGAINVWQDGRRILEGWTIANQGFGKTPMVYWGDATRLGRGASEWRSVVVGPTGGPKTTSTEPRFGIVRVWPNPMSDEARIELAMGAEAAVQLDLYDLLGRRIASIASGTRPAGREVLTMNRTLAGNRIPGGIYFLRLLHPGGQQRKQIVFMP
jgi:hypothetical protein